MALWLGFGAVTAVALVSSLVRDCTSHEIAQAMQHGQIIFKKKIQKKISLPEMYRVNQ